jgi:putative addiction module killer protein
MFTVKRSQEFSDWLVALPDPKARAAIVARILRVELGNFGDAKNVGGKVTELRVDVGAGYRVYLTRTAATVQLLLCGGDKSTQQADIRRAQEMVVALDQAKRAEKAKKAVRAKKKKRGK